MLKQIAKVSRLDNGRSSRRRMSYAQFLEDPTINPHSEWVNGEVVEMAPVSNEHSAEHVFLVKALGLFVDFHQLGEIRSEPFQMKTGAGLPGRSPDVLFVAKKNVTRLKKTFLDGPADLVIEIISPGSRSIDRGDKYVEYEKGGVREYWLLDPLRKQADFYVRNRRKVFELAPIDEQGVYHSTVLKGLWIKPAWLWQKTLPSVWDIARQWGLTA